MDVGKTYDVVQPAANVLKLVELWVTGRMLHVIYFFRTYKVRVASTLSMVKNVGSGSSFLQKLDNHPSYWSPWLNN